MTTQEAIKLKESNQSSRLANCSHEQLQRFINAFQNVRDAYPQDNRFIDELEQRVLQECERRGILIETQ
jgi:hypothetical protein